MRAIIAGALVAVLLAACSADGGGPSVVTSRSAGSQPGAATSSNPTSSNPTSSDPIGSAAPSQSHPSDGPASTATAPPVEVVFGDPRASFELIGTFERPVGLSVRPGDNALYVIEQVGRVVRWDQGNGVVVADLTGLTAADGERGLLGLAFSADGGLAWVNYTDGDGDTIIAEYPVSADGSFGVDAGRVVLAVDQPYSNHNGGDLVVGPDGMLYVALGDGGSANDPERRASDPTDLLGKLLRIDPAPSPTTAYSIPTDNPFAGGELGGMAGAPEVWAWGLRNPWRIAFDPVTAELWIADVGQNNSRRSTHSAIRGHPAGWGVDFGWSAYEGLARFNDDVADTGRDVKPVWTYEHGADGCSVSGGAVYRGSLIAGLAPAFVYGDYCSGRVWAFDAESGRNVLLGEGLGQITSVRAGPDGELYVTDLAGVAMHAGAAGISSLCVRRAGRHLPGSSGCFGTLNRNARAESGHDADAHVDRFAFRCAIAAGRELRCGFRSAWSRSSWKGTIRRAGRSQMSSWRLFRRPSRSTRPAVTRGLAHRAVAVRVGPGVLHG